MDVYIQRQRFTARIVLTGKIRWKTLMNESPNGQVLFNLPGWLTIVCSDSLGMKQFSSLCFQTAICPENVVSYWFFLFAFLCVYVFIINFVCNLIMKFNFKNSDKSHIKVTLLIFPFLRQRMKVIPQLLCRQEIQ